MHSFHICNFPLSSHRQSLAVPVCKASLIPAMDGTAQGGWRGSGTHVRSPGAIQRAAELCTEQQLSWGTVQWPALGEPRFPPPRLVRGITGSQLRIITSSGGSFQWTAQDARTWAVDLSPVTASADKWVLESSLGYWKEGVHPGLFQGVLKHLYVKKEDKVQ